MSSQDSRELQAFCTPEAPASNAFPDFMVPAESRTTSRHLDTLLREAFHHDPSIKDFIVHAGEPLWLTCARGTLPISELFTSNHPDVVELLSRPISTEEILLFVSHQVLGAVDRNSAIQHSSSLDARLKAGESYSGSVSLQWGTKTRVKLFRQRRGQVALAGRVSSMLAPGLSSLGLQESVVETVRNLKRGLILITGPMSSGKTATAQAILNHINTNRSGHIVTIEDPIETEQPNRRCVITRKEIGYDVPSFAVGLHDALRQSANVLLVGELRDAETIKGVISAAASGMLVIGTVHGDTIASAITRMMSILGDERAGYWSVLAQTLQVAIRQALVPSTDGREWVMAADVLCRTQELADKLEEGNTQSIERMARGPSKPPLWLSMNDRLLEAVQQGLVSQNSAIEAATEGKALQALIANQGILQ